MIVSQQISDFLNPTEINEVRCRKLVDRAVSTFELDLSDQIVLTEAATGYYMLTPLIAALAGARQVLALTRDSDYGRASDVCNATMNLARRWSLDSRIDVLFSRKDDRIAQADIVTNLGFVRPLNASFLSRLKPTVVIPLMWETWEYRSEDLDLPECRRLGIPVLGTNEHHPNLRIFDYIGYIAVKLLHASDIEIFRSGVVVIGSGEFAEQTMSTLQSAGAEVTLIDSQIQGSLKSLAARRALKSADALVVVEHHSRRMLIGSQGEIGVSELHSLNPSLTVIHICGGVDRTELEARGLRCYPERFARPGYMSVATDYLGPQPLIDLHTAGLKVGEALARARQSGLERKESELLVLSTCFLCQAFPTQ
jgi:hypothetical protein